MSAGTTLIVLAKRPRPGRVKTRLTPPYSPAQAADLAAAALADTLATVAAAPAARRLLVLDGDAGAVSSPIEAGIFEVHPQVPGGLDERLAGAFALVDGPALLVGMDTPQLTVEQLAVDWSSADAWLGAALDGGFWALGLRAPDPALLRGVPMSTPSTGDLQRRRLRAAGLRVGELPVLRDVDTAADADEVARCAPGTRFAACHARIVPELARAAG